MFKAYLYFLGALSLTGCATQPASNNSDSVSASIASEFRQKTTNYGEIHVSRDKGMMGAACETQVYINGKPAVRLGQNQKAKMYAPIGQVIVSIRPYGPCGGGTYEVAGNITANMLSKFRIGYGTNGDFFIVPTAF